MALAQQTTPREQAIAEALNQTYGEIPGQHAHDVRVKCVPKTPMHGDRAIALGGLNMLGLDNVIWLPNQVCDRIEGFMDHPFTKKDLSVKHLHADENKTLQALRSAAHEGAHAELNTLSESKAECDSFQTVGAFAVHLGMSPDNVPEIRKFAVEQYQATQSGLSEQGQEQYLQAASCVPGGAQDLYKDPNAPFPHQ